MGTIRAGTGLISGIDSANIVEQLISLQRAPIVRLENRVAQFQQTDAALKTLEANLLTFSAATQTLSTKSIFEALTVSNSDQSQLAATTDSSAAPGFYQFQTVRLASTAQVLSKGYANSDSQSVGAGTIVISNGGHLDRPTTLDVLNSGSGVRQGTIRITDRSGASADVDLSDVHNVEEVLDAINQDNTISVTASTLGGRLILEDTSGATNTNLTVIDLNGGHTAEDLGIAQSVSADTLNGAEVYQVTGEFTLEQINDGNGLRLLKGAPDIRITLTDDTQIEVNLDDAVSINDVVLAINDHEDNGGKLQAAFVDGHLELTDSSGGGGSSTFAIEDINNTDVVGQLGLEAAATGTSITGRRLVPGINSTLLANLRGGQGIDQTGTVTVTDRTGASASLDLSGVDSLDQVLAAINSAETGGGTKLQLNARVNSAGTGIEVIDTSGASASNLIIADVGGSTLADQLGISIDAAQSSVDSGSLGRRYVSYATTIDDYAPDGAAVTPGSIRITDSNGGVAVVDISSAVKNIGDVLQRINSEAGIAVTAELNETGDGFVLIDEAGGAGTLNVEDVDNDTAADLRLLGDSVVGGDGKQRITSRFATVIEVEAGDSLEDVADKINDASGYVSASVFDDGSSFNSFRLRLTATASGSAGRLAYEDGGLNLGLSTSVEGRDGLLRIGGDVGSGFLISSHDDQFEQAFTGIDIDVKKVGFSPAEITVSRDDAKIENALQSFVDGFNTFVDAANELTKFDTTTNERGILQGSGVVLRARSRLDSLVSKRFSGFGEFDSLIDLGIRTNSSGKLTFDKDRFAEALAEDRDAVAEFVLREDTGFAAVAKQTAESLTDPLTGAFALEESSLQESIGSLEERITQLDVILESRRERLILEFVNMENILSSLQNQQQSLAAIGPLSVNPISTGIL